MKAFKDLVIGDEFFILKLDLNPRRMKWEKVKLTCKSVVTSTGFTTLYYRNKEDDREGTVSVDPKKTSHRTEFRANLEERIYITDRDTLELCLKDEVEKARDYINDVELSYINLWDTSNEVIPQKYKKGDFLFFPAFESVALCSGEGEVYFADGEKMSLAEEKGLRIRMADRSEISDYLQIIRNRILYSQDKKRALEILQKCGYKYVNREFIQI